MLETLSIKNIAVIDQAEIPFKPGLNILSGETGAGKSIVIEAISLLLGSRASADLIRAGCDEAIVEGLFDTSEIPWIRERLERLGFAAESSELLIKRVIHRGSKHRIYINGELATLAILQDLAEGLVDLCGQHEHQSLIKPATQLELLDRYGDLEAKAREFATTFSHCRSLTREREALAATLSEQTRRMDFLNFQVQELQEAQLQSDEDTSLQSEKQLLQTAEGRVQSANAAAQALDSEGEGALDLLRIALSKLRSLAQMDATAEPLVAGMERAVTEAEEVSLAISKYLSSAELDPSRLTAVQERLAKIAELRRKYGSTVNEMIATLAQLEKERGEIGSVDERLDELDAQLEKARKDLRTQGQRLSQARAKIAEMLAKSVTAELKELNMEDARFTVELTPRADMGEWTVTGADQIQFCVRTNRGEDSRPLGKIASGGELSRLMLAIRRVIADRGGIGVYLFDEIDAGIGGKTATQVGKKLKSVAGYNQVICITHLPQVASFADHHLSVRKTTKKNRTQTEIIELSARDRKEELARMLGGPEGLRLMQGYPVPF